MKNVLFVCTINKMRSLTAEHLFKDDKRFVAKSAGTSPSATTPLNEDILSWADLIFVMEKHHRNFIRKSFPEIYNTKKITCLYISDFYDYMDKELQTILKTKMNDFFGEEAETE